MKKGFYETCMTDQSLRESPPQEQLQKFYNVHRWKKPTDGKEINFSRLKRAVYCAPLYVYICYREHP